MCETPRGVRELVYTTNIWWEYKKKNHIGGNIDDASIIELARHGLIDVIQQRLNNKDIDIDIDQANFFGLTAMHTSAAYHRLSTMQFLIEEDADLNVPLDNGITPLYHCCVNNSFSGVKILVEAGCRTDIRVEGCTPLEVCRKQVDSTQLTAFLELRSRDNVLSALTSEDEFGVPLAVLCLIADFVTLV